MRVIDKGAVIGVIGATRGCTMSIVKLNQCGVCAVLLILLKVHSSLQVGNMSPVEHSDLSDKGESNSEAHSRPHPGDDLMSDEKRLISRLLGRYQRMGKSGRPVLNVSSPVNVTFGLGLIQMDLDEKDKVLTMSMWSRYWWRDEYLQWDPNEYGGVTRMRLEPNDIWIPDIMLYNTADVEIPTRSSLAVVSSNGLVSWYPHCIYSSSCSVDVSNFPFDEQICHMVFGSWTHESREVDLQMAFPGGIDLSTFLTDHKESSAWNVVNVTAERQLAPSEDSDPSYAVLTFEIHLHRKLVFSSYILTLPCIFLASLTLVIFWLPPERPDRTALGMSTFSSFMVLLLILVESAPPTANTVPKLGVYYCFNLVVIMLSIILSSIVVNISRGPTDKITPVPTWAAFITLKVLSRVLFLKSAQEAGRQRFPPDETPRDIRYKDTSQIKTRSWFSSCQKTHTSRDVTSTYDCSSLLRHNDAMTNGKTCSKERSGVVPNLSVMDEIHQCLKRMEASINQKQGSQQKQQKILWQWKCVANVLDRLFFVLYILLNTMSMIVFFPRPKTVDGML